jgi:hypothetical protein
MIHTASTAAPLDFVLDGLMRRYRERVPDVDGVVRAMIAAGLVDSVGAIENDHIAFRTMGVPHLGIASFEKIFMHYGYAKRDYLRFDGKKLDAYWYAPPVDRYPRIFISELCVDELSADAQRIIRSYTDEVTSDPVDSLNLDDGAAVDQFLHSPLWRTPTWEDYQRLADESEYAAWVIYNRYYLNHFTVSVHNLPAGYDTVEQFNEFLKAHGVRLNNSGGEVKISGDGLLLQSSTVAEMVDATFPTADGGETTQQIAGSYVEFAERRVLPQFATLAPADVRREHRRDGFETANADKIFESTFRDQTGRR